MSATVHKSLFNKTMMDKFEKEYKKLQIIVNLINDETEEISAYKIMEQLNVLLKSTIELVNNPIKTEINKLIEILDDSGTDNNFFEQLNHLTEFIKSESSMEEYEPINESFINIYDNQEKIKGTSFLCPDLDKRTGGMHEGKICTIVGGPGSMKTTYATNICYEAIKQGKNVCFLSLEETPFDIYSKLLSRVSVDLHRNLSVQNITQHKLEESESELLKDEIYPYLENLKGTFYLLGESDLGDFSQLTIENKLKFIDERMKAKSNTKQDDDNHGIDIIVVDHLQMFKYVSSEIKDEFQLMNAYVSFFRRQSKKFLGQDREVAVILLSQCNREGIAFALKKDGSYLMQHVAEASEIERASSYIISVYTDAMLQTSKQIKIGAVKLRGAALPIGTINTYADGTYYHVGETFVQEEKNYDISDVVNQSDTTSSLKASLDDLLGDFS